MQRTATLRPTRNGQPVRGWRIIAAPNNDAVVKGLRFTNGLYRGSKLVTAPNANLLIDVDIEIDRTHVERWVNNKRQQIADSLSFGGDTVGHTAWVVSGVFPPHQDDSLYWTYHLIPLAYQCIDQSLWFLPLDGLFVGGVPLRRYQREGDERAHLSITVEFDDSYPAPPLEVWLAWLQAHLRLTLNHWEITVTSETGTTTFDCKHFSRCTADGNPVVNYEQSSAAGQIIHTVAFERPISKAEWETFVETRAFYYGYHPCGYGPANCKPQDPDSLDADGKTCVWLYTHWRSCD